MMLNSTRFYSDILGNFNKGIMIAKDVITKMKIELKNKKEDDENYKGIWKIF